MMMAAPFFVFIIILLIGMGFLFWIKGGKVGKWLLVFLGIFLVLLLVPHYFAGRSTVERSPAPEAFDPSQRGVRPVWHESIAKEYEADVYPSKEAALRALGARLKTPIEKMRQFQSSQGHPEKTSLTLVRNENEPQYLDAFREGIEEHTQSAITYAADNSGLQQGDVYIQISFEEEKVERAAWNPDQRISRGRISASVKTVGSGTTIQAEYVEKPWVEDFEKFQAEQTRPRNPRWIVGKSHNRARRSDQARGEALEDGVRQLQPLVEGRLRMNSGRKGWFGSSRPNYQEIQDFLRAELRGGIYVTDQFVQKFHKANGGSSIWWEGILINASERNVDLLADRCLQREGRQEWSWARTIWSAAGLLGLVCAVYLFLNLATRGYYAWVLRGAVVVIIIVFLVLLRLLG
jgi:hypothetical protein